MASAKHNLKARVFERDGWLDSEGHWRALCSFGCGDELNFSNATLDRYPIMGQHGGRYVLENVRLACMPCNSRNSNYKLEISKRAEKRAQRRRERRAARFAAREPSKDDLQRLLYEGHNVPKPKEHPSPEYSESLKFRIRENYPRSESVDRNGIPLQRTVIYDVASGKFIYYKY